MEILADSTMTALIDAPYENIDLTAWLFSLKDEEYQACSASHLAGGVSCSVAGKRMSINVELIQDNLLVQHYEEDIGTKDHCRVVSHSDSLSPLGKTKLDIVWELKISKLPGGAATLSNHVRVIATGHFLEMLSQRDITDLDSVKQGMVQHVNAHNSEETPLFARDIAAKAIRNIWATP